MTVPEKPTTYRDPADPPSASPSPPAKRWTKADKERAMRVLVAALDGPPSGPTKADRDRGRQVGTHSSKPSKEHEAEAGAAPIDRALMELDGEDFDRPRQNKAKTVEQAKKGKKDLALSNARQRANVVLKERQAKALSAVQPVIFNALRSRLGPLGVAEAALRGLAFNLATQFMQIMVDSPATSPQEAAAQLGLGAAVKWLNDRVSFTDPTSVPTLAGGIAQVLASDLPPVAKVAAVTAFIVAARRSRQGKADKPGGEAERESGWDVALRRSAGTQPRSRQALSPQHASQARARIRAAVVPAFAAALDKAVDAALLRQFAAKHSGGIDAAKLRAAYAEAANRAFAAEFVRLVGGRPPASAEDIALGAIIAVAIAQTTARYPIVPPAAIAPMAVLVHRTLRPRLVELARMAAVIAAAPAATPAPRAASSAPQREMMW